MITKVCTKCGKEKPRTKEYYPSRKKGKDGLNSWCRECKCVFNVDWRKKNKEHAKEYGKKHRKTLKGYLIGVVSAIVQRCTNSNNPGYKNYGKRGIKCLFDSADLFDWIVTNKIEPRGRDIHRINNDSNYTLNNIEFLEHGLHASLHAAIRKQEKK